MTTILFQGDSITDAGRNRNNDNAHDSMGCGYPLFVKGRLNCDHPGQYNVLNRGVSGDRVVDVYARIRRDIINLQPDVLSILIGVNDVWHSLHPSPNGVDADKFERVYDWLLTEVKQALPQVKLIILEPFVLPGTATSTCEDMPDRWEIFSTQVPLRAAAARRIAQKHNAAFVPLQKPLEEAAQGNDPAIWLRDGVHPAEAGHELIARRWMDAFNALS